MSGEPGFGEVRSILQRSGNRRRVFETLCAWVDRVEDLEQLQQELLPYIEGYLVEWPDEDRVVPARWVERMAQGEPVLGMAMARALTFHWVGAWRNPWGRRAVTAGFWDHEALAHVRLLDLSRLDRETIGEPLGEIGASNALTGVERLVLDSRGVEDDELEGLLRAGSFPRLRRLELPTNALMDGAIQTICERSAGWELEALVLDRNEITWEGLEELSRCSALFTLRELSLATLVFTEDALCALAGAPAMRGLRALNLGSNALGRGLEAMAASWKIEALERLDLWRDEVGADGLEALLEAGALDHLEALELGDNPDLGDAGVERLCQSEAVAGLRELGLFGCQLGEDGLQAILECEALSSLTTLNLKNNPGLEHPDMLHVLESSPHLKNTRIIT